MVSHRFRWEQLKHEQDTANRSIWNGAYASFVCLQCFFGRAHSLRVVWQSYISFLVYITSIKFERQHWVWTFTASSYDKLLTVTHIFQQSHWFSGKLLGSGSSFWTIGMALKSNLMFIELDNVLNTMDAVEWQYGDYIKSNDCIHLFKFPLWHFFPNVSHSYLLKKKRSLFSSRLLRCLFSPVHKIRLGIFQIKNVGTH